MRKLIFGGRLLVSKPPCKQGPPLSCLRLRSFFPVSSVQNVTKRSGIFAEPLLCDIQPHSCRSFMLVALSLALSLPPHRAGESYMDLSRLLHWKTRRILKTTPESWQGSDAEVQVGVSADGGF